MKMTHILTPLALAVSAVAASAAMAGPSGYAPPAPPPKLYHAGTAVVRLGAAYVDPDSSSSSNLRYPDIFPEYSGLKYDLDDNTTWQFSAMFMPMDHWSIEFGYVGESSHDLEIRNLGALGLPEIQGNRRNLGSLDASSSTLMINWLPVCPESWVQPYIGVGANYSNFDSVNVRAPVNDLLFEVGDAVGPARVSVDDSWGWAAQVGVDVLFGRESNWLVNAAVQYLDVETTSSLRYVVDGVTNTGAPRQFVNSVRTDLDVDPWVYTLGIGYKF